MSDAQQAVEPEQVVTAIRAVGGGEHLMTVAEAVDLLETFARIRSHEAVVKAIRETSDRYDEALARISLNAIEGPMPRGKS